jgi:signal transduction histidine kinase
MSTDEQARQLAARDTHIRQFQAELDQTNLGMLAVHAELAIANQRIADLLAMLSHDIRQPLGVITSYGSLLLEDWDRLDDTDRRYDVTRIVAAASATTRLVEEMLTVIQLDSSALAAHSTAVNLRDAIAEALAATDNSRPGTVTACDPPDLSVIVDPRHLNQMLVNLLSNALKYGSPPIEVAAARRAGTVEISVLDHGDPIPEEFHAHLFERYARADTIAARRQKGTGLGLYIVRQLAEANGGTVTHRRPERGGNCFTISLPA